MRWLLVIVGLLSFSYYLYAASIETSTSSTTVDRLISIFILGLVIYLLSLDKNNNMMMSNINSRLGSQQNVYDKLLTTLQNVNSFLENLNNDEIRNLNISQLHSILTNYLMLFDKEILLHLHSLRYRIHQIDSDDPDNIQVREIVISYIKQRKKSLMNSLQMYRHRGSTFISIIDTNISIDEIYKLILNNANNDILNNEILKTCLDDYFINQIEIIYNEITNSNLDQK